MKVTRVVSATAFAAAVLAASASPAQTARKPAATGAPPLGQARGTLTAKGKSFTLAHAAAFTDQQAKEITLLLTDVPVPAAKWTSHSDIFPYRMDHPFYGLALRFDLQRKLVGADVYADRFPTGTMGYFEAALKTPAGKAIAGTARSTAVAAKAEEPMSLQAAFNAALE